MKRNEMIPVRIAKSIGEEVTSLLIEGRHEQAKTRVGDFLESYNHEETEEEIWEGVDSLSDVPLAFAYHYKFLTVQQVNKANNIGLTYLTDLADCSDQELLELEDVSLELRRGLRHAEAELTQMFFSKKRGLQSNKIT